MTDKKPLGDFTRFIGTIYQPFILPILPHGAPLKPRESDGKTVDPQNCGKIPGRYLGAAGWVGMKGWQTYSAKDRDLRRWQHWHVLSGLPVPIGMQLSEFPAIDGDINRADDAAEIRGLVQMHFGETAVRTRPNSPRFTLYFRWVGGTQPVTKRTVAWFDDKGEKHAIDILGVGCQSVIEGMHKSGVAYEWLEGDLLDWAGKLPEVDAVSMSKFLRGVHDWIEHKGYTPSKPQLSDFTGGYNEADLIPIGLGDVLSPLAVTPEDRPLLTRCLQAINLDDPRCDYNVVVDLIRAAKAACDGDQDYLETVIHPWICTQTIARGQGPLTKDREDNGRPWLQDRWNSMPSSCIGAEYIYDMAHTISGYKEGTDVVTSRRTRDIFAPSGAGVEGEMGVPGTETAGAAGSTGQNASQAGAGSAAGDVQNGGGSGVNSRNASNAGPAGPGGGPTPFPWTDRAIVERFAAENRDWRHSEDQGWVRRESGVYIPHPGVIQSISDLCSAIGDPYRSQGPQGAKIDQAMKSTRKASEVERLARTHPNVFVRASEFDSDPWLLNTPECIIDLRDGSRLQHGMLMRQQTMVTPVEGASGHYDLFCPRWLDFLAFIADGRDSVVPFLRRWGAYSLVGKLLDQYFLFIHGKPGTGKSVFIKILNSLLNKYGIAVSKGFFARSLEKRTFELFQTIGKRGLFGDETMAGATWDEILFNTMLSGTEISAEGKGKAFVPFTSFAKITISGNHRPAFVQNSEEAGIDRRLLLLTANRKVADHMTDNTQFADELLRDEAEAILMWFVEEAVAGWRSLQAAGSFMGGLQKPFVEAARSYRRQSNPILQWVEDDMERGAEFDIDAKEAIRLFREYMREQNPKYHITRTDFRMAMEAVEFRYGQRSSGPTKGLLCYKGLRQTEPDLSAFGNVVQLPVTKAFKKEEAEDANEAGE